MNQSRYPFPVKEEYMRRALSIATQGLGYTSPNPTVGCVVVYGDLIIGEGFHHQCGQAHAEVNAIDSVLRPNAVTAQLMRETGKTAAEILQESTLYVTLEPCSHYGKTPPCAKKIIDNHIPRVVVCCPDPNPRVNGGGVAMLREAGVKVVERFLMEEGRVVARRFFTNMEKKRPYIILKWAQTANGFLSCEKGKCYSVTGPGLQVLNHSYRAQEDAIMVGTDTLLTDNPRLNARMYYGKQPLRVSFDLHGRVLRHFLSGKEPGAISNPAFGSTSVLHFFDGTQPSILFVDARNQDAYASLKDFSKDGEVLQVKPIDLEGGASVLSQCMEILNEEKIGSLIVEGGTCLINSFVQQGLWDEARVFSSLKELENGYPAPHLENARLLDTRMYAGEWVRTYGKIDR